MSELDQIKAAFPESSQTKNFTFVDFVDGTTFLVLESESQVERLIVHDYSYSKVFGFKIDLLSEDVETAFGSGYVLNKSTKQITVNYPAIQQFNMFLHHIVRFSKGRDFEDLVFQEPIEIDYNRGSVDSEIVDVALDFPGLEHLDDKSKLTEWQVAVGDQVQTNQVLVLVETELGEIEIAAPADGEVKDILVGPGQEADFKETICQIQTSN
jgi:hypothetical protein